MTIEWNLVIHLALDKSYARKDEATTHGVKVYKETHTRRSSTGMAVGKPETIYYMEDDERNFDTPEELIKAILEETIKQTPQP